MMDKPITRHPFNLIVDPFKTLTGRTFLCFLTFVLAILTGVAIFSWLSEGRYLLWEAGFFLFFATIIGGLYQGWGLLSYAFLFVFALCFITTQMRFRWLLLLYVVQMAEAFRCWACWYPNAF